MKSDAANQPATASVAIQLLQDLLLRPLQFRDAFSSLGFAMVTTTAATADQTNSTAMRVRTARVTRFVARTTAIAFRRRGFATEIPIAKAEQTRKTAPL